MSALVGGAKQQNAGEIQLIFGPMFSGKSTELLRRVRRFKAARRRCLLVKYIADTRYSESSVSTHDKSVHFSPFSFGFCCRDYFRSLLHMENLTHANLCLIGSNATRFLATII
jgi:hypothetical protein